MHLYIGSRNAVIDFYTESDGHCDFKWEAERSFFYEFCEL
jgi:hypothetical protein